MFNYPQKVDEELVRNMAMVRLDKLDYVDRQSIINIIVKTAREQVKDIDEAELIAANILWNDHNIEL